jgi:SAM-dependent methyltransferase
MIKLNLGCGQNPLPGYVNVDKFDSCNPDVVCDLEAPHWPFETSSVDEIVLRHVLEHLGATVDTFFTVMQEMYRVCAPGAKIHITVPHPRSEAFVGDPTHVRQITPNIMSLFSKTKNREWKEVGWPASPLGLYLDVDFETIHAEFTLTPHWMEKYTSGTMNQQEIEFAAETYFNVIDEIRVTLLVNKS